MKGSEKLKEFQISMAAARVNAKMTQGDVAKAMKLSKNTIVNWETGKVIPKPAQFSKYCEVVGIEEDYILLPTI